MTENWIWTDHIEIQISERGLSKELIECVVKEPDEVIPGKCGRLVYQKIIGNKLVRVVVDGNILITVYATTRIKKYMKGNQE